MGEFTPRTIVQELPGRPHERPALLVFVPARRFTDEGNGSVLRALAGDHFGTLPGEFTPAAAANFLVKIAECRHA